MTMEEGPVSKVTFDQITDFKFKAAYETYSNLFDAVNGTDERRRLNESISQLFNNEISYQHFYSEANRYRGETERGQGFRRVRIQSQRKRDYRRDQQERDRSKRHKR